MSRKIIFLILCILALSITYLGSQSKKIDPFYLNLLTQGERSLINGHYNNAVEELKIAIFGLLEEKKLIAKACVYLSISYYHLRNIETSKKYLKDAIELIGEDEIQNLDIAESLSIDLINLLSSYKLQEDQKLGSEVRRSEIKTSSIEQPEIKRSHPIDQNLINNLEKDVREQPRNIDLYYKLYNLYMENDDLKASKQILNNLVEKNPTEINGYFLLGKIEFEERNYKKAQEIFEKILDLSYKIQTEESITEEARAYLVLCSYLRGKRKKTKELVSVWLDEFTREKISYLTLSLRHKEMLQRIIDTYRKEAEAERDKIRIKKLESDIEKDPKDAALYYELYELYVKRRDYKHTKNILEDLVEEVPKELKAVLLLGKMEFSRRRYNDALERFERILTITKESYMDRNMRLKSLIYTCLCLDYLNQKEAVSSYSEELHDLASSSEIEHILQEEGLEKEWRRIKSQYYLF